MALHGSLFHAPLHPRGYSVAFAKLVKGDPVPRVFVIGRDALNAGLHGALATTMRPSGLAITADGSVLVGDDYNQKVWMIRWKGADSLRR